MNALTKIRDGFAGYEDRIEGDDRPQAGSVIQGHPIKFTNEATWVTRDGEELSPHVELVAVDIARVVQKWKDQMPTETVILEPGQKFPDVDDLNNKTPRSEWTKGPDGNLRGPWQAQHLLYLLNLQTMDRYTFPTGTTGGAIAIRDLVDRTKWMRRYRGESIYAVVTLSDTFMNTRFGGRQRPNFIIKRWVNLGDEEKGLPAPEQSPPVAQLEPAEAMEPDKKTTTTTKRGVTHINPPKTVEQPTLEEELNDEIPI